MSHVKPGKFETLGAGIPPLLIVVLLLLGGGRPFAQTPESSTDLPPSPAPALRAPQSGPRGTPGDPAPAPPQNARAAELWQDKPLGELTASIIPELDATARPGPEGVPSEPGETQKKLSADEIAKLNQARPLMEARGTAFSPLGDSRTWLLTQYEWDAPATRHLPLIFEDPNLERLGYTPGIRTKWRGEEGSLHAGTYMQPLISGVHFFGRVPFIPYLYGVDRPLEPIYTLGVDETGSPVPYRRHFVPLSLRGALYQAGATLGVHYIIP